MQVLNGTLIIFHVERLVCMMVVMGILAMHNHMVQLTCTLRHAHGTEHSQGLPEKDSQKDECAETAGHGHEF